MRHRLTNPLIAAVTLVLTLGMTSNAAMAQSKGGDNSAAIPGEVVVSFAAGTPESEAYAVGRNTGMTLKVYDADSGLALYALSNPAAAASVSVTSSIKAASASVVQAEPNYAFSVNPILVGPASTDRPTHMTVTVRDAATGAKSQVETELPSPEEIDALQAEAGVSSGDVTAQGSGSALYLPPNDPLVNWGSYTVNEYADWLPTAITGAEVAVIDSGSDMTHPDLLGQVAGKDWINNDIAPQDDNGHGTHVTGIIRAVANNAKGVFGVANGPIYEIKVLNADGSGTNWSVAMGINDAANRATTKIINLSLGGGPSAIIRDKIVYAAAKGKLIVIAAGNDGQELICDGVGFSTYPACNFRGTDPNPTLENIAAVGGNDNGYCDGGETCLSVTALDRTIVVAAAGDDFDGDLSIDSTWVYDAISDTYINEQACVASYSNYSASYVDIIAPGSMILSTTPSYAYNTGGGWPATSPYSVYSGTSMATPFVSGTASMVWGKTPTLTADAVKTRLVAWTGHDLHDNLLNDPDAECPGLADDGTTSTGAVSWESLGMADTPYLWKPGALEVFSLYGDVYDANSGARIPTGVTMTIQRYAPGPLAVLQTVAGAGKICNKWNTWCSTYFSKDMAWVASMSVNVQVTQATYTTGAQTYWSYSIPEPGLWRAGNVYLPQKANRWEFIVSWPTTVNSADPSFGTEVDAYLITPPTVPFVYWVGAMDPFYETGTLNLGYTGDLTDPTIRAAMLFDSWYTYSYGFNALGMDHLAVEKNPAIVKPWFFGDWFFVATVNDNNPSSPADIASSGAAAFVWDNGVIKHRALASGGDTDPFWVIGKLNSTSTTAAVFQPCPGLAFSGECYLPDEDTGSGGIDLLTGYPGGFSADPAPGKGGLHGPIPPK